MKTDKRATPITDAETMRDEYDHVDLEFGPFAPSGMVPADFARDLERQLAESREYQESETRWAAQYKAERDSLKESINRCHDAIGESRDSDHSELYKFFDGQSSLISRVRKAEEQRDALAEACKMLMRVVGPPNATIEQCWAGVDEIDAAYLAGESALAKIPHP